MTTKEQCESQVKSSQVVKYCFVCFQFFSARRTVDRTGRI